MKYLYSSLISFWTGTLKLKSDGIPNWVAILYYTVYFTEKTRSSVVSQQTQLGVVVTLHLRHLVIKLHTRNSKMFLIKLILQLVWLIWSNKRSKTFLIMYLFIYLDIWRVYILIFFVKPYFWNLPLRWGSVIWRYFYTFRLNLATKGSLLCTVHVKLILCARQKVAAASKNVSRMHQPTPFAEAPTNRRNINEQKLKLSLGEYWRTFFSDFFGTFWISEVWLIFLYHITTIWIPDEPDIRRYILLKFLALFGRQKGRKNSNILLVISSARQ